MKIFFSILLFFSLTVGQSQAKLVNLPASYVGLAGQAYIEKLDYSYNSNRMNFVEAVLFLAIHPDILANDNEKIIDCIEWAIITLGVQEGDQKNAFELLLKYYRAISNDCDIAELVGSINTLEDDEVKAFLFYNCGQIYRTVLLGTREKALQVLESAKEVADNNVEDCGYLRPAIYHEYARAVVIDNARHAEAIILFNDAIALAQNYNNHSIYIECILALGNHYQHVVKTPQEAKSIYTGAITYLTEQSAASYLSPIYLALGYFSYYVENNCGAACDYFQLCCKQATLSGDYVYYSKALLGFAQMALHEGINGSQDIAYDHHINAKEIAKQHKDDALLAEIYYSEAKSAWTRKYAIKQLNLALKKVQKKPNNYWLAKIHLALAQQYKMQGNHYQKNIHAEKAQEFSDQYLPMINLTAKQLVTKNSKQKSKKRKRKSSK
jgi:tetratricopeptide (TPR) repeat protein